MQIRNIKFFLEDYILYPIIYFGICLAAIFANILLKVWDILVFIFSFGKKK